MVQRRRWASAGRMAEAVREAKVLAEWAQMANQNVIVGSIEAGDEPATP